MGGFGTSGFQESHRRNHQRRRSGRHSLVEVHNIDIDPLDAGRSWPSNRQAVELTRPTSIQPYSQNQQHNAHTYIPAAQTSSKIAQSIRDKNSLFGNVEEIIRRSKSIDLHAVQEHEQQQQREQINQKLQEEAAQKQKTDAAAAEAQKKDELAAAAASKLAQENSLKASENSLPAPSAVVDSAKRPPSQREKEAAVFLDSVDRIKTKVKPALKADKAARKAFFDRKIVINTRYIYDYISHICFSIGQVQNSSKKLNEIHGAISRVLQEAKGLSNELFDWLLDFTVFAVYSYAGCLGKNNHAAS